MKNFKIYFILILYRSLGYLLNFFLSLYYYLSFWQKKDARQRLAERLALKKEKKTVEPLIWMHGASVGETAALIPLIQKLKARKFQILLTTGTKTSADMVKNCLGNYVTYRYSPLDFPPAIDAFLDHWKPVMAIIGEAEIWPTRALELYKRNIYQIFVSAHMSDKSYKTWIKYKDLSHYIFSKFDLCLCQTERDVEKYLSLGVKSVKLTGNLKAEAPPLNSSKDLNRYKDFLKKRSVWIAASIHEGEEESVAEAHKALKERFPNLITIIVPRYIDNLEKIVNKLKNKGLSVVRRSEGEKITSKTDIFLGDTIGEMGFYLSLGEIVFMGKSLEAKGGHNPLEPALLGKAILSGPNTENFKEVYKTLVDHKAIIIVKDAKDLALHIKNLLSQNSSRLSLQQNTSHALQFFGGPLGKTIKFLMPFLESIILQAGLNKNNRTKYKKR